MLAVLFLVCFKGYQLVAKAISYAVYLSHHSGAGGTSTRVLHGILLKHVQGSVIYDIDNLGQLGFLIDAVRVSLNLMVVFGSESLCRPWCIGAIVCAHRKGTPLHTIIFTNPKPEDTVCGSALSGGGTSYVKTFTGKVADKKREATFEVDTFTLRGYGLALGLSGYSMTARPRGRALGALFDCGPRPWHGHLTARPRPLHSQVFSIYQWIYP